MASVEPFLWFQDGAEAAVNLYTSIIEGSGIESIDSLGDPAGTPVLLIHFHLGAMKCVAMQAQGGPAPNDAFSLSVSCQDQAEVDKVWDSLVEGGEPVQCGWLKDKWGFRWQVVPKQFNELMETGNAAQRAAVMGAMMQMVKFDVPTLQSAYDSAAG